MKQNKKRISIDRWFYNKLWYFKVNILICQACASNHDVGRSYRKVKRESAKLILFLFEISVKQIWRPFLILELQELGLSIFPSLFSTVCWEINFLKIGFCRHCNNLLIYLKHLKNIQSFKFNKLRRLNILIKGQYNFQLNSFFIGLIFSMNCISCILSLRVL